MGFFDFNKSGSTVSRSGAHHHSSSSTHRKHHHHKSRSRSRSRTRHHAHSGTGTASILGGLVGASGGESHSHHHHRPSHGGSEHRRSSGFFNFTNASTRTFFGTSTSGTLPLCLLPQKPVHREGETKKPPSLPPCACAEPSPLHGPPHTGKPSYYKRSPRPTFVTRAYKKLKRLLRDLVYYAKHHPVKVFMLVIMPLLTGGALTALLARFGLRMPAGLERMMGMGAKAMSGDSIGLVGEAVRMAGAAGLGGFPQRLGERAPREGSHRQLAVGEAECRPPQRRLGQWWW